MFERRLKIFLGILMFVIGMLLLRAFHLQVLTRGTWLAAAEELKKRPALIETTRGRILDCKGLEIAVDEASMNACVDYRAIVRDPKWIRALARSRLIERAADDFKQADKTRKEIMIAAEAEQVTADIDRMFALLAKEAPQGAEQVEDTCRQIDLRVAMGRRKRQYDRYLLANEEHQTDGPPAWYRRWLIEGGKDGPQVDDFDDTEGEEVSAHPVVQNISPEGYLRLSRAMARCPGLELRPGTHRKYPFGAAGCHLIGTISPVNKEDIQNDPNFMKDPLREYNIQDVIGRGGLEALCEPALRGTRGRVYRLAGTDDQVDCSPQGGADVRSTIDIQLQYELQKLFEKMDVPSNLPEDKRHMTVAMHGAAVVIDIKSGAVRAMASYPDFDLNKLQEDYELLAGQTDNAPLLNRATQSMMVPGSTIKPVVGISAITQGLNVPGYGTMTTKLGIECTGYLVINKHKMPNGRCWVASKFEGKIASVAHHPIPSPHHGSFGNPDGFLCFADALERSCNVYFETVADAFGANGLSVWYDRFGLGRETGIGIAESRGMLPRDVPVQQPSVAWFSGIGQVGVLATPIQMANIAATIARDGVWLRPRLVEEGTTTVVITTRKHVRIPDRVDLELSKDALAAAREGMIRVVNSPVGTGTDGHMDEMTVAGKTGTAQGSELKDPVTDANGKIVHDDKGKEIRKVREPATIDHPTATPWYRGWNADGKALNHAWFIGFAPANDPQVAFAVLVQYGGSGGHTAAETAKKALIACVEHGYIKLRK